MTTQLIHGDCLEEMKKLPDGSVDLVLTDPPYELGFMGKSWDSTGIANNVEVWKQCLRVLKPGGHVLAFSGTRTYHRMASAIEDAGFEVRDMIEWVYGSGFPKSLNIGKAVDKLQGNKREDSGKYVPPNGKEWNLKQADDPSVQHSAGTFTSSGTRTLNQTKGTSEWEGWGTALKPAHEPICMARKPLSEKSVAENCLKYGTGGINIDESRVEGEPTQINKLENWSGFGQEKRPDYVQEINTQGRFPANLIHDNSEEVRDCFPETGVSKGGQSGVKKSGLTYSANWDEKENSKGCGFGDSGNASRFFKSIVYVPKASKSERNKGCEELEEKETKRYGDFEGTPEHAPKINVKNTNNHPTVKPVALMEYLAVMASREGATILDPFMGSGTTGVACKKLGRNFIGIELDKDYIEIAKNRIESVQQTLL